MMFKKKKKTTIVEKATQTNEKPLIKNVMKKKQFVVNEQSLRELLLHNIDIHYEKHTFGESTNLKVLFVYCEGMVDLELMNRLIMERLENFINKWASTSLTEQLVQEYLYVPSISIVKSEEEIIKALFSGQLLIQFENYDIAFTTNIAHRPQRTPEESNAEVTVRGPRDNFIEDLVINIALIRKRLRTTSLHLQQFEIGERSKTKISLLYMEDIANKDIVDGIVSQLQKVETDAIYSGDQLMELIEKPAPLFPRHHYSGRPDFAVKSLLKGRCILLIDGVAYSIILPANLFFLTKSAEDNEYPASFNSVERVLRIAAILISIFAPGFWIAVTTFHQNQLPSILLANVVASRQGLPFPSAFEALLMLFLFELFREAGMRLPTNIGASLTVFGALIIGDAAIRAGLTSPAQVVVMSASLISSFTIINQSLAGIVALLRVFVLLLSSFLGFFGFFISFYFILTYLSNQRSFGVPFMELASNFSLTNMLKAVFRLPVNKVNTRPKMFYSDDPIAQGDDDSK